MKTGWRIFHVQRTQIKILTIVVCESSNDLYMIEKAELREEIHLYLCQECYS